MKNFNINNGPEIILNAEEKFVYNYYKEDETITNDLNFIPNVTNVYKCIELKVKSTVKYDKRIKKYLNYLTLDDLDTFSNKNLSESDLSFFNMMSSLNKNYFNTNISHSNDDIDLINKSLNVEKSDYLNAISFLKGNKNISIKKYNLDDVLEANKQNIFFTKSMSSSIEKNAKFFSDNTQENFSIDNIVLNENFKTFRKKSVYNAGLNNVKYYLNVGFLIEKFLKTESLESDVKYVKKSSFFKRNVDIDTSALSFTEVNVSKNIDNSFIITDSGVKYGKTYKYLIYPVYLTSISTKKDYHTIDDYIFCGYPVSTSDVECKESTRPIPPPQLSFKLLTSKNTLKINWQQPLEQQGDVKGYQIFKRYSLEDPFVLIRQFESHNPNDFYTRNQEVSEQIVERLKNKNNTVFYDNNFKKEKIQIYAICSIDAHGFVSNYSSQYAVKYNHENKSCEIDLVSTEGAPLHMPNLLVKRKTKFFDNENYNTTNLPVEENVSKITLYCTPEYREIGLGTRTFETVLKSSYKFSIFKIENLELFTDTINIVNF
tara:strand:- start:469 stop:2097 length:1629 start_codon:yes stop_codon:yes gene_type:complete